LATEVEEEVGEEVALPEVSQSTDHNLNPSNSLSLFVNLSSMLSNLLSSSRIT
jgi:hypothetical protein